MGSDQQVRPLRGGAQPLGVRALPPIRAIIRAVHTPSHAFPPLPLLRHRDP